METWPFFNQATANLVPLNAKRVAVKFDAFKVFSLIPIKARGSGRGQLEITYLDKLRISRGNEGNLFILRMVDPTYRVPVFGTLTFEIAVRVPIFKVSRAFMAPDQQLTKENVKASLAQGHPTYVLMRRELGFEIEKLQMLLSFKKQGTHLVEGSFSDHQSLVDAVKQVDVVICTMSGVQFRSHNILLQLKLVDAIKEAGNVKRFLPSEFGIDPSRMVSDVDYGKETFEDKIIIRKAIEDAKIPYTYISANGLGGYFVGNLSPFGSLVPPKERVSIYGDGNCKDLDDPRMLNKTLYLRPDENIVTQNQLVEKWEKVSSKTLEKVYISKEDFLASMKLGDLL
ncbi:isoflavone reductase [Tanacetum coccineum]|uniref:Isoflavone reductase n=1 Tax=Tanacetum coccineum TaxID=301880 RepID=A0ABQ5IIN8_9ASTR